MTVNRLRVEWPLGVHEAQGEGAALRFADGKRAIEARPATGMAGSIGACRLDHEPDGVLVAIGAQLDHALRVAALLAFAPQAPARARPVMRLARLDGAGERLGVHVGEHQHFARLGRGRDNGEKPVLVEARSENGAFLARSLTLGSGEGGGRAHRAILKRARQPRPRSVASIMKRACWAGSSLKMPVNCVVMVATSGFFTPRIVMH